MVGLVGLAGLAVVAAAIAPLFDPMAAPSDLMITVGSSLGVALLVVALTWPLRYEMDLRELRVQSGLIRRRVALADVVRVETFVSPLASPTAPWTSRRVRVHADGRAHVDVGPADRTGFLAELLARAPQLQERSVGGRRIWLDPSRT